MAVFKIVTSKFPVNTIRSESEILEELYENITFYDDYDFTDYRNNFIEAFSLISDEFASVKDNNLTIQGYGLKWCNYKNYLKNIFPEIFDVINDLKMDNPTKLIFYDLGSGRIINFRLNMEDPAGNTFYSWCVSLINNESIGTIEIIDKEQLIKHLVDSINGIMLFVRLNYPSVYKKFLYPYLKSHNFAILEP